MGGGASRHEIIPIARNVNNLSEDERRRLEQETRYQPTINPGPIARRFLDLQTSNQPFLPDTNEPMTLDEFEEIIMRNDGEPITHTGIVPIHSLRNLNENEVVTPRIPRAEPIRRNN